MIVGVAELERTNGNYPMRASTRGRVGGDGFHLWKDGPYSLVTLFDMLRVYAEHFMGIGEMMKGYDKDVID